MEDEEAEALKKEQEEEEEEKAKVCNKFKATCICKCGSCFWLDLIVYSKLDATLLTTFIIMFSSLLITFH